MKAQPSAAGRDRGRTGPRLSWTAAAWALGWGLLFFACLQLGLAVVMERWRPELRDLIPDVQPAIMLDEFLECEQACKASPEWQAAMRRRGITEFDLCMVDPWSAGNFGIEKERGRRISRALTWVRSRPDDNGYAHPIEGSIFYDEDDLVIAKIARDFGKYGIEPRHMRIYRHFAQREAGLFHQAVVPHRGASNDSKRRAVQSLNDLAKLSKRLKQLLLRASLREHLQR